MNQQKRRIGFTTAFTDMMDDFNKVSERLEHLGAAWEAIMETAYSEIAKLEQASLNWDKVSLNAQVKRDFALFKFAFVNHWSIVKHLAALGLESNEMHKQVTNIEKDVKELKRSFKATP